MNTIPTLNSWLLYLLLFLFCFIVALFIGKIMNWGGKKKSKKGKRDGGSMGLLVVAILLVCAVFLAAFAVFIFTFSPYSPNRAVMTFQTSPARSQASDFNLIVRDLNKSSRPAMVYPLNGSAWGLSGECLTWNQPVPSLGLRSMYRLTMLRGYYPSGSASTGRKPSALNLAASSETWLWKAVMRLNKWVPLASIKPVQTSTRPLILQQTYSLLVTAEGFQLLSADEVNGNALTPSLRSDPRREKPRTKYPGKLEDLRK